MDVIDSGGRYEHASGMLKDTSSADKPDFTLLDLPFLTRLADHMTKGAKKYGRNNWRKGNTNAELEGFEQSAFRHLVQWLNGEKDEDHAAAVVANIMMHEGILPKVLLAEMLSRVPKTPRPVYDTPEGTNVYWEVR